MSNKEAKAKGPKYDPPPENRRVLVGGCCIPFLFVLAPAVYAAWALL